MTRPDLRGGKAVAAHIGVSVRTMWKYAAQPQDPLPLLKLGGTCVAYRRDIDAWMARALRRLSAPAPTATPSRPKPVERRRYRPRAPAEQ